MISLKVGQPWGEDKRGTISCLGEEQHLIGEGPKQSGQTYTCSEQGLD